VYSQFIFGLAFLFATQRQGKSYLSIMIQLTKGNTETIVLTLKEKQTLSAPNYLFRFVHRATNVEVKFVKLNGDDSSAHKDRFNQFSIAVNSYFGSKESGEWEYFIYEQASTTNTNPASATSLLEQGLMRLNDATTYTYTKYQTSNTFITR
jgi:hypothetical protein